MFSENISRFKFFVKSRPIFMALFTLSIFQRKFLLNLQKFVKNVINSVFDFPTEDREGLPNGLSKVF